MRNAVCAILLCGATVALGQSGPAGSMAARKPEGWLSQSTQSARVFRATSAEWLRKTDVPPVRQVIPGSLVSKNNNQIDPGMVVRPPRWSAGEQPQGTLLAQNLYPGLQLLPIGEPKSGIQAIPAAWPNLRVKPIPTVWPHESIKPLGDAPAAK